MLHDVGKVGVPDVILQKPAKLTDEEFEIIKRHPELGAQILEHPKLSDVRAWVGAHHERPDGRGYPLGLLGDEVSLEARILSVADAFEAMTSDRAYRAAIGHASARAELQSALAPSSTPRSSKRCSRCSTATSNARRGRLRTPPDIRAAAVVRRAGAPGRPASGPAGVVGGRLR